MFADVLVTNVKVFHMTHTMDFYLQNEMETIKKKMIEASQNGLTSITVNLSREKGRYPMLAEDKTALVEFCEKEGIKWDRVSPQMDDKSNKDKFTLSW